MLMTMIIDIESCIDSVAGITVTEELHDAILTQGFSDRVPVVKMTQQPTIDNDFEGRYTVLRHHDVVAAWPFPRITVFIVP